MKVTNIGIIVRNDLGDTFPVALTPNMVGVIQNLLTQIPLQQKAILAPDGMKAGKADPSIPIIPREIDFDWAEAYKPMQPDMEKELMAKLKKKYDDREAAKEANITSDQKLLKGPQKLLEEPQKQLKEPQKLLKDPLNPFNMTCDAEGTANAETPKAGGESKDAGRKDCTVTPDSLGMGAGLQLPGG
jgi:hypothetical protein